MKVIVHVRKDQVWDWHSTRAFTALPRVGEYITPNRGSKVWIVVEIVQHHDQSAPFEVELYGRWTDPPAIIAGVPEYQDVESESETPLN